MGKAGCSFRLCGLLICFVWRVKYRTKFVQILHVHWLTGKAGGINGWKHRVEIRLALLPQMWRENENADTVTYGAGGFSSILSEVQIYLCNQFQGWKN